MTKQLVRFAVAVMSTFLALLLLWQFRIVIVYVIISLALVAALRPMVNRIEGRGWMLRWVWVSVYLLVLGCFGVLLFLAGEAAFNEIQQLAQTVSAQDKWQLPIWLQGSAFQQALVARLPAPSKLFEAFTGDQGQRVLPTILGLTQGIGGALSDFLVILFLSLYWMLNQIHFERLWLSLLPSDRRKPARDVWRTIELDLGAYLRSELVQSILAALLLGLGYWLLGSPYPALLAIIGALAWLVPVVGALLAVILPLVMGLLTSVQLSLITALYTLLVLIALQVGVEPRLFRRKWDNPILTLIILLGMADAFGLLGILVAPPLSAVCQILWNLMISSRTASGSTAQVSNLKERQAHVWATLQAMDEPPMALVTSGMQRLSQLLEKAEHILQASPPEEPAQPFHLSQPVSAAGGTDASTTK